MSEFAANEFARGEISDEAKDAFAEKRNLRWTKLNELH